MQYTLTSQSLFQSVNKSVGWLRPRSISLTPGREGRVRHHCGVVMMPFFLYTLLVYHDVPGEAVVYSLTAKVTCEIGLCTVYVYVCMFVCVTVSWHSQASVKCFTVFDVEQPGSYHTRRLHAECFDDASV